MRTRTFLSFLVMISSISCFPAAGAVADLAHSSICCCWLSPAPQPSCLQHLQLVLQLALSDGFALALLGPLDGGLVAVPGQGLPEPIGRQQAVLVHHLDASVRAFFDQGKQNSCSTIHILYSLNIQVNIRPNLKRRRRLIKFASSGCHSRFVLQSGRRKRLAQPSAEAPAGSGLARGLQERASGGAPASSCVWS